MIKVLLVEDSAVVRERLIDLLQAIPHVRVVGVYDDGDGALSGIRDRQPDVVLLDIRLRNSSGIDVLQYVARELPHIKVIVLTNYAEPQYRKLCLKHGAYEFLDKSQEFQRVRDLLIELAIPS